MTEHRQFIDPITSLPDDMADAFDAMRLSILRQRHSGWSDVSSDGVIQMLYVLQRLAMADEARELAGLLGGVMKGRERC